MKRRIFLLLLMTSLVGGITVTGANSAFAKDGDGGGEGSDGGKGGDSRGDGRGDSKGDGRDDSKGEGRDNDDDDDDGKDDDRDSSKIRSAVKRGEAASLGKILPAVRRKYPGKVIRIRLTGKGSKLTYRIRVISRDNKLFEIRVDALSGMILGISEV